MAGRPAKYKDGHVEEGQYSPSHPEQLLEKMKEGLLDCQIYAHFQISKKTFYKWIQDHPEFEKAYELGLAACEAAWLHKGEESMKMGKGGSVFNYWIAIMNNKFKWAKGTYGDSATVTNNIAVNNMNVIQSKGRDDLLSYIKRIALKNQDVLNVEFIESTSESNKSPESKSE